MSAPECALRSASMHRSWIVVALAALFICACAGSGATPTVTATPDVSGKEVTGKALDAMARVTFWKEKRSENGVQRTKGQDGKRTETKLNRSSTHAFQPPDRVDSAYNDTAASRTYRYVDIGATRYYQEPAGSGPWRSVAVAATKVQDATLSINSAMRLFLQGDKLKLGADVACGAAACFRIYTPEGPFESDADPAKFVLEMLVDKTTLLPTRWSVQYTYVTDGQGYTQTIEFYEYGRQNDIRPPK